MGNNFSKDVSYSSEPIASTQVSGSNQPLIVTQSGDIVSPGSSAIGGGGHGIGGSSNSNFGRFFSQAPSFQNTKSLQKQISVLKSNSQAIPAGLIAKLKFSVPPEQRVSFTQKNQMTLSQLTIAQNQQNSKVREIQDQQNQADIERQNLERDLNNFNQEIAKKAGLGYNEGDIKQAQDLQDRINAYSQKADFLNSRALALQSNQQVINDQVAKITNSAPNLQTKNYFEKTSSGYFVEKTPDGKIVGTPNIEQQRLLQKTKFPTQPSQDALDILNRENINVTPLSGNYGKIEARGRSFVQPLKYSSPFQAGEQAVKDYNKGNQFGLSPKVGSLNEPIFYAGGFLGGIAESSSRGVVGGTAKTVKVLSGGKKELKLETPEYSFNLTGFSTLGIKSRSFVVSQGKQTLYEEELGQGLSDIGKLAILESPFIIKGAIGETTTKLKPLKGTASDNVINAITNSKGQTFFEARNVQSFEVEDFFGKKGTIQVFQKTKGYDVPKVEIPVGKTRGEFSNFKFSKDNFPELDFSNQKLLESNPPQIDTKALVGSSSKNDLVNTFQSFSEKTKSFFKGKGGDLATELSQPVISKDFFAFQTETKVRAIKSGKIGVLSNQESQFTVLNRVESQFKGIKPTVSSGASIQDVFDIREIQLKEPFSGKPSKKNLLIPENVDLKPGKNIGFKTPEKPKYTVGSVTGQTGLIQKEPFYSFFGRVEVPKETGVRFYSGFIDVSKNPSEKTIIKGFIQNKELEFFRNEREPFAREPPKKQLKAPSELLLNAPTMDQLFPKIIKKTQKIPEKSLFEQIEGLKPVDFGIVSKKIIKNTGLKPFTNLSQRSSTILQEKEIPQSKSGTSLIQLTKVQPLKSKSLFKELEQSKSKAQSKSETKLFNEFKTIRIPTTKNIGNIRSFRKEKATVAPLALFSERTKQGTSDLFNKKVNVNNRVKLSDRSNIFNGIQNLPKTKISDLTRSNVGIGLGISFRVGTPTRTTTLTQLTPLKPIDFKFPNPKVPPRKGFDLPEFNLRESKKSFGGSGFDVLIKASPFGKNQYFKLNRKSLSLGAAQEFGAEFTKGNINQSFRITKSNRPIEAGFGVLPDLSQFYGKINKSGGLTFIERRKYAINTPGEKIALKKGKISKRFKGFF